MKLGETITYKFVISDGTNRFDLSSYINTLKLYNDCKDFSCIDLINDSIEGILLPDTYFYKKNTNLSLLLNKSSSELKTYVDMIWKDKPIDNPLKSKYEGIILSSIIEKESSSIEEKMKVGVALADFNGNGIDDIVFGTDSDNLHLIYDDLLEAPGFPLNLNDKLQSAPSIVNYADQKYIFVGSKDDHLYSIDSSGNIRFAIETDGNIYSSPSFNDTDQGLMILFGSSDVSYPTFFTKSDKRLLSYSFIWHPKVLIKIFFCKLLIF